MTSPAAPTYTIEQFLETRAATSPSLSADGARVAYLANLTGVMQVYVAGLDAAGAEARQVTRYDDGVSLVAFSPASGDEIVFQKDRGGDEMHQLYRMRLADGGVTALTDDPSAMHTLNGWSRDGRYIAYSSTKRNGTDHDIYVYDLDAAAERIVFDLGGWCSAFGFSPSGDYLVVSKARSGYLDTELFLADLRPDAPAPRLLTPHDAPARYAGAEWLPDQSGFYTVSNDGADTAGVCFYDLATGSCDALLRDRWDVEEIALSGDGRVLAVNTNEDGYSRVRLYEVGERSDLRPMAGAALPEGEIAGLAWATDAPRLAYARNTASSGFNVWVTDVASAAVSRPVTSLPQPVPAEAMATPELIHYRSFDGLDVPAFVYRPRVDVGAGAGADGRVPAIVWIHGGPEGQFRPAFNPLVQYFVYRGYAVIAPNVRGSDGYGKEYLALDDRRLRLDSVRDLEALRRWAEGAGSGVDPERMALMGGSYGGYMVLAGLAFQPGLWAAGVDIVGIANLVSFLENTAPWRRSLREAEYGYLATDRDFLAEASPINKAGDIRVPLFIIHGANDPRVPLSEATQMRDMLASRGVTVDLLVYDDEGHGLAKLKNRLDAYPKAAAFLDDALKG